MIDVEKKSSFNIRKVILCIFKRTCDFKSKIDYCAIIAGIYLIVVYASPSIMSAISKYLFRWFNINCLYTYYLFTFIENISWLLIITCIFLTIAILLGRTCWDKHITKLKGESRFEQCALRYMNEKGIPHCLLISGDWGCGKTYDVNAFLKKYYRYSHTKYYRVSCFGLGTRKEVIEEINNTIEHCDKSLYKTISELVQYIPIIGKPMNKLVSKSYRYDKAKKGSIFVFDDFERITSRSSSKEILQKESDLKKGIDYALNRSDYDKYTSIAGLINELIETYKMKVFIICNSDVIGEKFIYDVLRSKLNCIEYKKDTSNLIRKSVIKNLIKNSVFEDNNKQIIVEEYMMTVLSKLNNSFLYPYFINLRMFSGLFEAFINEIGFIDNSFLSTDFLDSLFRSIALTHAVYYNNDLRLLDRFENGMNIAFQLNLYNYQRKYKNIIKSSMGSRWVDISLSGHWILNLSKPENMYRTLNRWKDYKYADVERKLIIDPTYIDKAKQLRLIHVLFAQQIDASQQMNEKSMNLDYKTAISKALQGYDLTRIDTIQDILDAVYKVLHIFNNEVFFDTLFQALKSGNANGDIVGEGYIYDRYRSYIEKEE